MTHPTQTVMMPNDMPLKVLAHRAKAHDFGTWEAEAIRAISSELLSLTVGGRDAVVYDVGAEEGEFSALWGHMVGPGNVHLFEPTPSVWPNIRATWEANHGGRLPGGMWAGFVGASMRGPGVISSRWPECSDGNLQNDSRFSVVTERPDIPCITIDAYTNAFAPPDLVTIDAYANACAPPDLIAIDVEGAELLVVAGALQTLQGHGRRRRPTLAISIHPPEFLSRFGHAGQPCTQERLFRMLSAIDYVPRWISVDHESHWMFVPRERASDA